MKIEYVELPLDPEYITQDGAYMAGYIWGQHVRSEKDARQMFPGDTSLHDDFYKGVSDGFNDKMNEMKEQIEVDKLARKPAPSDAQVVKLFAEARYLYDQGLITDADYRRLAESMISKNPEYDDVPF